MSKRFVDSAKPYEIQAVELEGYVSGYFYTKNGEYANNNGDSAECYVLNDAVEISTAGLYLTTDVKKLGITHDDFTYICGVLIKEDPESFESLTILTQTTFNAVKMKKGETLSLEEQAKYAKKLLKSSYSSVSSKESLSDNNENNSKKMRKALIHVLLGGKDYSNGCIAWDGVDFLTEGMNHQKSKEYGGISISKEIWEKFVNTWFVTDSTTVKYREVEYNKSDCINNIPFITEGLSELEKEEFKNEIKEKCPNLYSINESIFETYQEETRSGYPSMPGGTKKFKWVLNKAEKVVGKSIFWKPDKERNVGYAWKKYFGDNFFL